MSNKNTQAHRTPVEVPREVKLDKEAEVVAAVAEQPVEEVATVNTVVAESVKEVADEPTITLAEFVEQEKIHRNIAAGLKVYCGNVGKTYAEWKNSYNLFMARTF